METITLKGGFTIPEPAIWLAVDLSFRGYDIRRSGQRLAVSKRAVSDEIGPENTKRDNSGTERDNLTEIDRELIAKWRDHLLVVVDYCNTTIPSLSAE